MESRLGKVSRRTIQASLIPNFAIANQYMDELFVQAAQIAIQNLHLNFELREGKGRFPKSS